jgi:hypothetical protein
LIEEIVALGPEYAQQTIEVKKVNKDLAAGFEMVRMTFAEAAEELKGQELQIQGRGYAGTAMVEATARNQAYRVAGVAGVPTTFTVVIPNGLYEIKDINNFLQFTFIANGHYLVDGSGLNVYYAEFIVNPTRYAIQINTFPVPTALPLGWSNPAGLVFPLVTFNPIITLPPKFNDILGFTAGFTTPQNLGIGTNLSFLSSKAPQVQPNNNLLVGLSGIDNKYANPSSIIYSVSPAVGLGELITDRPANFNWNRILAGTYNQLRLQFIGNTYENLNIRDPNMTIILVIQDQEDLITDVGAGANSNQYGQQHSKMMRSGVVSGSGFR